MSSEIVWTQLSFLHIPWNLLIQGAKGKQEAVCQTTKLRSIVLYKNFTHFSCHFLRLHKFLPQLGISIKFRKNLFRSLMHYKIHQKNYKKCHSTRFFFFHSPKTEKIANSLHFFLYFFVFVSGISRKTNETRISNQTVLMFHFHKVCKL